MVSHTMDDFRRELAKLRIEGKTRAVGVQRTTSAEVAANTKSMTIKRLAWAFGCAAKDSETELTLYRALVERILNARKERGDG